MPSNPNLLRRALLANALFSATSGAWMVAFPARTASMLGVAPPWLYAGVGIALLTFALGVGLVRARLRPAEVRLVSALDIAWVLGTLPLAFSPLAFTTTGRGAIAAVASIVGAFALLQLRGLRDAMRDPTPPRCAGRPSEA